MKYFLIYFISALLFKSGYTQSAGGYDDSLEAFRTNYIITHEVVKKDDRQFLRFYPVSEKWRINCKFEKITDPKWFEMSTSGKEKQTYRRFGKVTFTIHDTLVQLYVYQSQSLMSTKQYHDYLFIPFTDLSSGIESYGGGRYLESAINDIKGDHLQIDFNKAYNPYCAYTTGYNCPIPPKENDLPVAIYAGEKNYSKKH